MLDVKQKNKDREWLWFILVNGFTALFQGIWKRIKPTTYSATTVMLQHVTCELIINMFLVRYKCCAITDGPKNISTVTDILVQENCIIGSFMIYILT